MCLPLRHGGLHLDEKHDAAWIRENIINRLGVPAALIVHGADPIASGSIEKIEKVVKETRLEGLEEACLWLRAVRSFLEPREHISKLGWMPHTNTGDIQFQRLNEEDE